MKKLTLLLVVTAIIKCSALPEQCKKDCESRSKNCIYQSQFKCIDKSKRIWSNKLSEEEKNAIVAKHNELRQKVAKGQEFRGDPGPQPAGIIPDMEWDDELAKIALLWANKCEYGHDPCIAQNQYKGDEDMGQNIAYQGSTSKLDISNFPVTTHIQRWYDEVDDVSGNWMLEPFESGRTEKVIGHYTQLIWAKSTRVGCAHVKYFDGGYYISYLVCNYRERGNIIGDYVYKSEPETKDGGEETNDEDQEAKNNDSELHNPRPEEEYGGEETNDEKNDSKNDVTSNDGKPVITTSKCSCKTPYNTYEVNETIHEQRHGNQIKKLRISKPVIIKSKSLKSIPAKLRYTCGCSTGEYAYTVVEDYTINGSSINMQYSLSATN